MKLHLTTDLLWCSDRLEVKHMAPSDAEQRPPAWFITWCHWCYWSPLPGVIASLRVHGKRITPPPPPPPPSVSSANNYKINKNMSWKYAIHTKLYNPSNVLTITSTYKASRRTNRTKKEPCTNLKKEKRRAVNVASRLKIFFLIDTDGVVPSWRHTPRVKFSFLSLATFFILTFSVLTPKGEVEARCGKWAKMSELSIFCSNAG